MSHRAALCFADGKTLFIEVKPGELLLDAALRQGVRLPLDCREGVCGTCQGLCESGDYQQDYVDEDLFSEGDLAQRKVLACQTRLGSDAAFYFDLDSSRCQADTSQRLRARVQSLKPVSDNTAVLELQVEEHPGMLQFLPGQYARLRIPGSDQWRAYSFANRPNRHNRLQFLIRLLPDGAMGRFLEEDCRIGMPMELEAPFGSFYLRQVQRPLLLVAGGTGLSAFLGMLDEMAERGGCGQPVCLFYGVNRETDLCEIPRLDSYCQRIRGFDYQPVVSQPSPLWQGLRGYIPDHFQRSRLAESAHDIYLCGPPPMVDAVKGWLGREALNNFQLYSEKFVKS